MNVTWIGPGSLPLKSDIEYRVNNWPDTMRWVKTQIMYLGKNIIVFANHRGGDDVAFSSIDEKITVRPVGGVYVSEHKEYLEGVVGIIEATRHEQHLLWKEHHYDAPAERRLSWERESGGPLVTVGKLDDRPVTIALMIAKVNGHRILFMEACSELVDWKMIEDWLYKNMPNTAYQEGREFLNKHDPANFRNVLPRGCRRPPGMQSSFSDHSPSCNRQQNGTFCDCGAN